jgi:hypothetical protein
LPKGLTRTGNAALEISGLAETPREERSRREALLQKKEALLQKKKEQGAKPCSKNCVDPVSPKSWI